MRAIQQQVGITFIYITHDQGEALTMSDRIAVMSDGVIQQVSDGKSVYDHPDTAFVASFVGENNPFPGTVKKAGKTGAVVETALGLLRGAQSQGTEGRRQGHSLRAAGIVQAWQGRGRWHASRPRQLSVAFEGNVTHVYLKGARKEGHHRDGGPSQRREDSGQAGEMAVLSYDPEMGVVLPEGKMARE